MIGNIIKGSSFEKVVHYVATKDRARFISGNMVKESPLMLAKEFNVIWDLNTSVEKAVFHISLSLTKEEHLSDEKWKKLARDYLDGMDFGKNQYVVYQHQDTPHEHIHIIANRVRYDGSTVSTWLDYSRNDDLVHALEKEYGLITTVSSKDILRKSQSNGELRQLLTTGEESIRQNLQDLIDQTTSEFPNQTMPDFIARLKEKGVETRISLTKGEAVKGISYEFSGMAFSGTQLGKAYTFPGLQKHKGIEYNPSMFTIITETSEKLQKDLEVKSDSSTLKTTTETSENKMIQTNQHIDSEKVFLKAKKLFNQLHKMKALKENQHGQYEFTGKRRKMVYFVKEKRFSLYDRKSNEELLRVLVGEKIVYDKENLTETDLLIIDEALIELAKINEQSLTRTKKDGLEIE